MRSLVLQPHRESHESHRKVFSWIRFRICTILWLVCMKTLLALKAIVFRERLLLPRKRIAIARKSQPQIATRGIGGYVSPSHFHSPVGVHRPNLSLVAPEDPQAGAAALHAPDPDGPSIKNVRANPRNLSY